MILTCERCKNKVDGTSYSEGSWGLIEEHYSCPYCGLQRHWAYGHYMPEDSEYAELEVSKEEVVAHMKENKIPEDLQLTILLRKSKMIDYIETKMLKFR